MQGWVRGWAINKQLVEISSRPKYFVPPFMGGVITNETWTCSPTMLLIYATVSQMPRNQMNNGNANHMPTWIHPCPPDEQKEKAPVLMFL